MKSIIPGDTPYLCFLCGKHVETQTHHCLHGSRRGLADKYGLTVHLCPSCHTALHDTGRCDRELEVLAQWAFEENHTHAEWMRIFGKNYREEKT